MNNLLHRRASSAVHRICRPPNSSSGVRWSSYVGDVRMMVRNLSKSYHHRRDDDDEHERLLVIGSGVAGCAAALSAARHGVRSTVLHAGRAPEDCNSYWAQGGIVYRNYHLREGGGDGGDGDGGRGRGGGGGGLVDTSLSLVEDVRRASGYRKKLERGHDVEETSRYAADMRVNHDSVLGRRCPISGVTWNEDAAWKLALEGPARVRELLLGSIDGGSGDDGRGLGCVVPFDRGGGDDGGRRRLGLCLEASHSAPRIAAALALRLEDRIVAGSSSSSSGGVGGVGVGGGGRKRGGGEGVVSDLEYVQFHPTALCVPGESRFLLTEALRGEGAILRDADGRPFARDYHPDGELAPRDVVARAVYEEIRRASSSSSGKGDGRRHRHGAYLDITHRDPSWLVGRFPGVHAHLTSLRTGSLDLTTRGIPVTPAAHYACGGVTTDLDGRVVVAGSINAEGGGGGTIVRRRYRNLYAAGEAARTGLHGGNRLASTSLLEGLVFGSSVGEVVAGAVDDGNDTTEATRAATDRARRVIERRSATTIPSSSSSSSSSTSRPDDAVVAREASAALTRLRSVMWEDVGVVRSVSGLERASSELSAILDEADRLWDGGGGTREVAALRDAARAGLAVAHAALSNRVSGGCHYLAATEEEEDGTRGGGAKEQDSDSDDDDGLIVARA
ncbi:hypothetical protein ACHAW5_008756 [Stephanodiscus triporus]|uniref:L-aspartate oxidase n=1 Tax=Stephanodiscus triporus TaxID=2934178 RepID=A0ABD3QFU2_9STRA